MISASDGLHVFSCGVSDGLRESTKVSKREVLQIGTAKLVIQFSLFCSVSHIA